MKRNLSSFALISSTALALLVSGCSIHTRDNNGESGSKSKDVSISSPFGGLKVRTDQVDAKDTGLTVYPGAKQKPESDEHNQSKANVNVDTPWFGLKVVAITYVSDDPQEKVWDYYRKEMSKYGKVLECKPGSADMSKQRKEKGDLTCDEKGEKKGFNFNSKDAQLKVGTEEHQRVVGFKNSGNGTEFTLLYLLTHGETKDSI